MSSASGQPENQPPPPVIVPEEDPVVEPENDDGYEADDEGPDGWPQDPFVDEDNMSVLTDEGEVEAAQPEVEERESNDSNDNN